MKFFCNLSSEEIIKRAIDYLKAVMKDEVVETVKEPETPKPPTKKPKLEFVQLLANKVNGSDLINNLDQTIQFELDKYLNNLNVDMSTNIFEWWHQRKSVYPRLHSLMVKYLIIPATSAASERFFSSTGLILEDRRSRLSDENVNMLIFLFKNFKNK